MDQSRQPKGIHVGGQLATRTRSKPTLNGGDESVYGNDRIERYRNGLLNGGPNGEPAVVRPDGTTSRYRNDLLNDGPNGEPAVVGTDGTTSRYRNGVSVSS